MIEVKDINLESIGDVFSICAAHQLPEDEFMKKGKMFKEKWIKKMLKEHGSCIKIAYKDGNPVAQILYYPEDAMKYIQNTRKNVIHIQCIFNPFPEYQKLGAGTALMNNLIEESRKGIEVLGGEKCRFLVSYIYPSAGGITFDEFYKKMGFKQGQNEVYYEVTDCYSPREISEYVPLPEDKGKISIFFNPTCEYGYFAVNHMIKIVKENFPNVPVSLHNLWTEYNEYLTKPQQTVVSGRMVVNQRTINDFLFWSDPSAWLKEIKNRLEHDS